MCVYAREHAARTPQTEQYHISLVGTVRKRVSESAFVRFERGEFAFCHDGDDVVRSGCVGGASHPMPESYART